MMARSLSNAKLLSALVADGFSTVINSRGYAASSQGLGASLARAGGSAPRMVKKAGEEAVGSSEKVAWVPDPVTGYYKPENRVDEIDVAELRSALLGSKR